MKVLVTGSSGFLGSAIVQALKIAGDNEVISLRRTGRGESGEVVGDLTNPTIAGLLPEQIDLIVHAAAYVPVKESAADGKLAMAANAEATLRLLEYSVQARVTRFIYISSAAVYGVPAVSGAVKEGVEPRPDNAYALSKLAGELILEPYHFVHGIETVGLRFSYIYGKGMRESSVVKKFATLAQNHATIPLLNSGRDFFDLIHISDAVRAVQAAMERGTGIYNVGSGKPTSVLELAATLVEIAESHSVIEKLPPKDSYHSKYLDISKAVTELNWQPAVNLREGLRGL